MIHSRAALSIGFIGFAVMFAATLGSRLPEQTVSLLIGAACGTALTAPFAIVAGMYFASQRSARQRESTTSTAPQPPIVVVTPPQPQTAMPAYNSAYPAAPGMTPQRQYTIVGEETIIDGNETNYQ